MTKPGYIPDSGHIIWLDLKPRTGHEQSGRRPCLVLSGRLYAERTGLALVCPITSKVKGLPFEILLPSLQTVGAVLPIHVRSVDWQIRKASFIEIVPTAILKTTRAYVAAITGIS